MSSRQEVGITSCAQIGYLSQPPSTSPGYPSCTLILRGLLVQGPLPVGPKFTTTSQRQTQPTDRRERAPTIFRFRDPQFGRWRPRPVSTIRKMSDFCLNISTCPTFVSSSSSVGSRTTRPNDLRLSRSSTTLVHRNPQKVVPIQWSKRINRSMVTDHRPRRASPVISTPPARTPGSARHDTPCRHPAATQAPPTSPLAQRMIEGLVRVSEADSSVAPRERISRV